MGAATAWRLAERGVTATCFDRHSPPHDLGSSHGETRMTRTAYYEAPWYVPLLQRTFPMWRELEASTGADLLSLTGGLMIGRPASTIVAGALAAARDHALASELLPAPVVRARYPGHVLGDDEVAVLDAQAGFVRPEAAIAAMIGRTSTLGGELRPGVAVRAVESRRDGIELLTPAGRETFDRIVVSAGAHIGLLLPWLPVTVTRQVLAWFDISGDPARFAAVRFPVFFHTTDRWGDVYGFPTLDRTTLKLARHHPGEPADPETLRRQVGEADLAPLRGFIDDHLRGVVGRVARAAVCMYTNTPDRNFVVDLHPADRRIVVVSACSGHGFKFAPVIGEIAADLVTQGGTGHDITHFSIGRLGATPAFCG